MKILNMNFNFIVKSGDKLAESILCSKPQNTFNKKGLRLAPALKKDTVQFSSKAFEEINTKADELLKKVRNFSPKGLAKYICLVYDKSVDTKQKYIVSGK